MPTITIKRPNRFTNRFRKYKLFMDGELIGSITNNETKAFTIEAGGQHQLHATIDCYSSPLLLTNITAAANKRFVIDIPQRTSKLMSYFFYSGFAILLLDFVLKETLDFPYALILMVFPLLLLIYQLTFERKKQLVITEILSVNQ